MILTAFCGHCRDVRQCRRIDEKGWRCTECWKLNWDLNAKPCTGAPLWTTGEMYRKMTHAAKPVLKTEPKPE